MSKDEIFRNGVNFVFILFLFEAAFVVGRWIIPEGFLILIPFIAVGVWVEIPRFKARREVRQMHRELDSVLRSSTDRDRL